MFTKFRKHCACPYYFIFLYEKRAQFLKEKRPAFQDLPQLTSSLPNAILMMWFLTRRIA